MFFFREIPFYLKTKTPEAEKALGVFVSIKVTVQGDVNSESGMILNLKDVDFALAAVKKNFPVMKSRPQAFLKLYKQLENLLGEYFFQLEMSWDQHSIVKSKKSFYRTYETHVWFQEDEALVKRTVKLRYQKLGLSIIKKMKAVQSNCHLDDFLILIKQASLGVSEIRIKFPEILGERVY